MHESLMLTNMHDPWIDHSWCQPVINVCFNFVLWYHSARPPVTHVNIEIRCKTKTNISHLKQTNKHKYSPTQCILVGRKLRRFHVHYQNDTGFLIEASHIVSTLISNLIPGSRNLKINPLWSCPHYLPHVIAIMGSDSQHFVWLTTSLLRDTVDMLTWPFPSHCCNF